MKREGRQHGMVRTHMITPSPWNARPNCRVVNKLESHPTAGSYTRVSSKPTNHSKFTSKCGRARCEDCHTHPVCKSRDKAKGGMKLKLKSCNREYGMDCVGKSASGTLSQFSGDYWDDEVEEEGYADNDPSDHPDKLPAIPNSNINHHVHDEFSTLVDEVLIMCADETGMSFYDVVIMSEQLEGDEDWFMVEDLS